VYYTKNDSDVEYFNFLTVTDKSL